MRACATARVAMGWADRASSGTITPDIFAAPAVQPLLWLFIFGTALQQQPGARLAARSDLSRYRAPGVMAQAALFVAIFFGLGVIWERDVGQLQRVCSRRRCRGSGSCSARRPVP